MSALRRRWAATGAVSVLVWGVLVALPTESQAANGAWTVEPTQQMTVVVS